jgi:hypothetical protein
MAASTVTYFGDVTTVGNTVVVQNLTSQGYYSIFTGNVSPAVTSNLGSVSGPWNRAYLLLANVTSANLSSIFVNTVGINVESDNTTNLLIEGNALVSNVMSAPVVIATTSANVMGVLNTSAIFTSTGLVGINTSTPSSNLHITGNVYASRDMSAPVVIATTSANVMGVLNTSAIFTSTGLVGINTSTPSSNLYVTGNIYTSNSFQTPSGLFTKANATTSNLQQIFFPLVGVGCVPVDGGATLQITGNLYTSNALSAVIVYATTSANVTGIINTSAIFSSTGLFGINTGTPSANLHVSKNILVSNSISTLFANATTSNALTLNVTSIPGKLGIGATLEISGNIRVTNALSTTNIFGTSLMNVTTQMNTSVIYGTGSSVGFNRSVVVGGPTLQILSGNIYVSNSISSQNIFATLANTANLIVTNTNETPLYLNKSSLYASNIYVSNSLATTNIYASGTIYYGEDLTRRSPHLIPDAANTVAIQNWIVSSCNATQKVGWSTSQAPVYSNITRGPLGKGDYSGSVYLPDGRVLFVPGNASAIGIYNPKTIQFTSVSGTSPYFNGGVLLPSGNVLFAPQTSNIGLFNPVNLTFSNSTSVPGGAYNAVLTSNNVILAPQGTPSNIINFTNGVCSNVRALLPSQDKYGKTWTDPVTAGTGNGINFQASYVTVVWSPELRIFVALANDGDSSFIGGVYSTDGKSWLPNGAYSFVYTSVTWSPQLGLFVAVANSTSDKFRCLSISANGRLWDGYIFLYGSGMTDPLNWTSVTWSPELGLFVAIASGSTIMNYSTDGKNWLAGSMTAALSWKIVIWSPQLGLFVAIASSSTIMNYSIDGKNWTDPVAAGTGNGMTSAQNWRSVAWSPQLGLFVAVANSVKVINYSTDGKNWVNPGTTVNGMTSPLNWTSVTWSPELGLFVAISSTTSTQTMNYSTDGKKWLAGSMSTGNEWQSVTWSPELGLFVAVAKTPLSVNGAVNYSQGPALKKGACLLTNGNVIVPSPGTANVIQFNPNNLAASNIVVGEAGFNGLTLAPNGNVIGTPMNSNIIVINPGNSTSSNINLPSPNTETRTTFRGACLLPTGNIIFGPTLTITLNVGSSNIGMFDPSGSGVYSNSTASGSNFSGATLVPSGQVVFCPSGSANVGVLDAFTPTSREFCMSPYFNKF